MGGRLGELAQLHSGHVKVLKGIDYIDFRDDHLSLSLKNAASVRETPIHPVLIRMGFLDFVASRRNSLELFPEYSRGKLGQMAGAFSKRFGRLLDKLDLVDPDLVYHSLRHTTKTHLRQVCDESVAESIVGHEGKFYGGILKLPVLLDVMKKTMFVEIKFDHLLKKAA
ncbi:MAG: integrase family protein [Rhodospirillales bacterium]|nr:integrase family protein [Rhodospirillales bacterium]